MGKKLRQNSLPAVLIPVLEFYENDVAALASAIGRTPQAVYAWVEIPRLAAYEIERVTDGRFLAHTLNKDCIPNGHKRSSS